MPIPKNSEEWNEYVAENSGRADISDVCDFWEHIEELRDLIKEIWQDSIPVEAEYVEGIIGEHNLGYILDRKPKEGCLE